MRRPATRVRKNVIVLIGAGLTLLFLTAAYFQFNTGLFSFVETWNQDTVPIPELAASIGTKIMLGTPEYTRAVERAKAASDRLRLTAEYQIDLDKYLFQNNRETHVREFFIFLNKVTRNMFNFSYDDHKVEGYHRYSFNTDPKTFAKSGLIIRQRDFHYGWREGLSTLDMKFRDGPTFEEMLDLPGRPAAPYIATSVQKIEQDIHACDRRWSRGTRLFFRDDPPVLKTVADLKRYFPGIDTLEKVELDLPLQLSGMDVYYWQLSHVGTLPNGLHYKSTFTFMYKSLEAALSDQALPKKDGEWSFRLYGGLEGYAMEFVNEHKRIVDDMFLAVVLSQWNVDPEIECLKQGGYEAKL